MTLAQVLRILTVIEAAAIVGVQAARILERLHNIRKKSTRLRVALICQSAIAAIAVVMLVVPLGIRFSEGAPLRWETPVLAILFAVYVWALRVMVKEEGSILEMWDGRERRNQQ